MQYPSKLDPTRGPEPFKEIFLLLFKRGTNRNRRPFELLLCGGIMYAYIDRFFIDWWKHAERKRKTLPRLLSRNGFFFVIAIYVVGIDVTAVAFPFRWLGTESKSWQRRYLFISGFSQQDSWLIFAPVSLGEFQRRRPIVFVFVKQITIIE